jgi:hypothetical protein
LVWEACCCRCCCESQRGTLVERPGLLANLPAITRPLLFFPSREPLLAACTLSKGRVLLLLSLLLRVGLRAHAP